MALQTASAYAVNKCVDADGKISYQDAACPVRGEKIDVVPANPSTEGAQVLQKSTAKQRAEVDSYVSGQNKEAKQRENADAKLGAKCRPHRDKIERRRVMAALVDNAMMAADPEVEFQRNRMKELGCSNIP